MKTSIFNRITPLCLALATTLPLSVSAVELEEIVVTAQSRAQSLQDVPISVLAVTGDALQDRSIARIEDLQLSVPNFSFNETGIATNIFIRGIGSGINQGFEQSVGTYIDGVYYGRAQSSRAPFLDLERVEVLRGAQSILFGKNSIGGALNITTAKPTETFEGYGKVSYEFLDGELAVESAVSGPLTENLRGRLAFRYRDADGYYENLTSGEDEAQRDDLTIRGQLEMDLTDNLTALLKIEHSSFDVIGRNGEIIGELPATEGPSQGLTFSQILVNIYGQDASVANNTFDGKRSSNSDNSFNETDNYSLTLNWDINGFEIKSITALTNLDYDELCDCDFSGARIFDAASQEEFEQFSQEIRLTSPVGDNFDYIAGIYYQTSEHNYQDQIIVATNSVLVPAVNTSSPGSGDAIAGTQAARIAKVDNDVLSLFAQFNWHITEQITLQIGGRYTDEDKDAFRNLNIQTISGDALPANQIVAPLVYGNLFGITSDNLTALAEHPVPELSTSAKDLQAQRGIIPVNGTREEKEFTPDIKLQYQLNDNTLWYLSYVEGVKSGGFDFRANNRGQSATLEDSFEFETEEAKNYEVGGKFLLVDGSLEVNATAFFTDFSNLQISIFDGILGFNVGNAAAAEIKGLELDGRYAATERLTLATSLAFIDFEFTDFQNGQCYFGQTSTPGTNDFCDYTGNSQQNLPDFTGNFSAEWTTPIFDNYNLDIYANLHYSSEFDSSATYDPVLLQDAFVKIDARVALAPVSDNWEVALLVKNLTDENSLTFGGDTPLAGSTFGVKSNYSYWAQGRTLALQLSASF